MSSHQETQDQPIGPQKPQATDIKPTPASAPIPAAPACPTMPMPEAVMANGQYHIEYVYYGSIS
jgi:hypothetical protein